jgi:Tfp pilus assembly protein PilF
VLLLAGLLCAPPLRAAERCDQGAARLVSLQGAVEVRPAGSERWQSARLDQTLCGGDRLRVLEWSRAALVMPDETIVRLDQSTSVTLTPPPREGAVLLDLLQGAIHFFSRTRRVLEVHTPIVNGVIEGTEVVMASGAAGDRITVIEGALQVENDRGRLVLRSGESASAAPGQAPLRDPQPATMERIQWAIYYPPLFGLQTGGYDLPADRELAGPLAEAARRFQGGDAHGALKALPTGEAGPPELLALRASLLLYVGRVEQAAADIARLRQADPRSSEAAALEAVIAAAQNRKEEALARGREASTAAPDSAPALVALSIARQAGFDLPGARDALQRAVAVDPASGLAWARLAEIQLSLGERDDALRAAERASVLLPQLARVQVVHGFALLAGMHVDEAAAAFQSAVARDSADPMPRLGLGLARIRKGALAEGRREIEIAAALDPANALIRSYLGKAYFEEKRDKAAGDQLAMAKQFDPFDPTPHLYDAIRKQTGNRPVEALHDIQRSMALNDNRAVYRSRLLLDGDLAVRGAGLGQIYRDLGFERLALVEGVKSIDIDPANASAHRLLADAYASAPRHDVARVSELLQAQLLHPLNPTPLQPELAETNLRIVENTGPADLGLFEYHPLFLADRLHLTANGLLGGNDTRGDNLIFSGIHDRYAFSLGQFHYFSDGFRDNNDQRNDIYNAFFQAALSEQSSLQAEYRDYDFEWGDTPLNFYRSQYVPDLRMAGPYRSARLGAHHEWRPGSDLLYSGILSRLHGDTEISGYDIEITEKGIFNELQHRLKTDRLRLIYGAGHLHADTEDAYRYTDPAVPGAEKALLSSGEYALDHTNAYLYAHIPYPDSLLWTLGASVDLFRDQYLDNDKNQFNPKLGLTWTPTDRTTVRAAVFRVLKRYMSSNQTIEPTQVAGFNQYYDEFNGMSAWRCGLGVDQKFGATLFGGLEYATRQMQVDFEDFFRDPENPSIATADYREQTLRAYGYWAPLPWLAASLEGSYDIFETDERDSPDFLGAVQFTELKTLRLPLSLRFFHPAGFSAAWTTSYVHQEVALGDPRVGPLTSDSDSFWVTNAAVSYDLPRRRGKLSLLAKNLFDTGFNYLELDPKLREMHPERTVYLKLSLFF